MWSPAIGQEPTLNIDRFGSAQRVASMNRVPINREVWSPSSRRSLGNYDASATEYEGISYRCRACEQPFVWTAAEQQDAHEVQKKHVSSHPSRCPACRLKLAALRDRDRELQTRWDKDRSSAAEDLAFVREWHDVMLAMSRLKHQNPLIVHLERLLSDAA